MDVDNSGNLDFEEFCFLAQKFQAVMDMSQQEVDDGNSSAAAEQKDAIHRFHRQNAPTRQARRLMRGVSRNNMDLGVPQIDILLDADALHFECEQGANHEQHVTLRNTGSSSLYFAWEQQRAAGTLGSHSAAAANSHFVLEHPTGILYPGQAHTTIVLFRSPVAGVFTSHFELQLTPPLPNTPPPSLALRGVSTPLQADLAVQRRALGEQLVHKQSMHAVRDIVLRDVLGGVFARVLPAPPPEDEADAAAEAAAAALRAEDAAAAVAAEAAAAEEEAGEQWARFAAYCAAFGAEALTLAPHDMRRAFARLDALATEAGAAAGEWSGEPDDLADLFCGLADARAAARPQTAASRPQTAASGKKGKEDPKEVARMKEEAAAARAAEAREAQELERLLGALELLLRQLAAPPRDTARSQRHAVLARGCVVRLLDDATSVTNQQRRLFDKVEVEDMAYAAQVQAAAAAAAAEAAAEAQSDAAMEPEAKAEAEAEVAEVEAEAEVEAPLTEDAVDVEVPAAEYGVGVSRLVLGGVVQAYCWETAQYEPAANVSEVAVRVRGARVEAGRRAAERAALEERKKTMSKRELKMTAKKEAAEAEAEAVVAAQRAEAAAAAAAALQAERDANPTWAQGQLYASQLDSGLAVALRQHLLDFAGQCIDLQHEAPPPVV